ncbi:MAG: protein kinase [Acidobacteria bacterium]|nr:protein kinase [Acidobacteriota bacterium]
MHIGSTISHYKIVANLGEGGMGVVYKAEDTKLERTVALKFLADHLLSDQEAKERFLREAKAAAALHHPNVCPVHEIDEVDGKTFLAMAFLEGESLEERIAQGPLSIKDALDIARQVADGLEAAHEKGIVHRDIKPANIMVDAKGHATIMDFGLARLTEASRLTKVDTAMGTVAYMSPEQAQGMEVDHRSDIWALGCVLYEMVSGQRPFLGQYDQALLYEIVHEEAAPLTSIRAGVPMELEFIVGECLAKDRDDRTSAAQDLARKLRTLAEKLKSGHSTILRTAQMTGAVPAMAGQTLNPAATLPPDAVVMPKHRLQTIYGLAAAALLTAIVLAVMHFSETTPGKPVTRFSFTHEGIGRTSISPDGKYILFAAEAGADRSLWLRSLSDESPRRLAGTEGAIDGFWSPDSSSIGFGVVGQSYELKRVSISGGIPVALSELPDRGVFAFEGGTWSPDGERIVFSSGHLLYEIAARGGQPQLLLDLRGGPRPNASSPHFLPAGSGPPGLVFRAASRPTDRWVAVLNLETGDWRELGPGDNPVYSLGGYLIHGAGTTAESGLWARPFSLKTLEPTADAFPISTVGFAATVSYDGTLAYRSSGGVRDVERALVWRDRAGQTLQTVGQPLEMAEIELSPDGQRVAVRSVESGGNDIWIQDLIRSTKTRLTFDDGPETSPTWSPSGREIAYRKGNSLLSKAADGTGEAVVLVEDEEPVREPDWSHDGRYLVYVAEVPGLDIHYLEIQANGGTSKPVIFVATAANEDDPKLSSDGRFLAYVSDESGRAEVYVRPFPEGAGKWQVSANGGLLPRWRGDGSELFYLEGSRLMAVTVSSDQSFTLGQPRMLFQSPDLGFGGSLSYDVSADGQRFIMTTPIGGGGEQSTPPTIMVVQNWYEEFRDRQQ